MVDPNAVAGMIFTLLLAGLVGGFILLYPLSRRLGALLEQRLNDSGRAPSAAELQRLTAAVESLRLDVDKLSERQAFTEALLAERPTTALPRTDRSS